MRVCLIRLGPIEIYITSSVQIQHFIYIPTPIMLKNKIKSTLHIRIF